MVSLPPRAAWGPGARVGPLVGSRGEAPGSQAILEVSKCLNTLILEALYKKMMIKSYKKRSEKTFFRKFKKKIKKSDLRRESNHDTIGR